ncbi:UDP-N-acetylbacillosamine transaminase [compost metagenome]
MPNLNAALACAQLEQLDLFVENKRNLASLYKGFFNGSNISFINEPVDSKANYWLNAILLEDLNHRNKFLEFTNANGIMTRPVWELLNRLPMFKDCQTDSLINSIFVADRLVNIPSGVRLQAINNLK